MTMSQLCQPFHLHLTLQAVSAAPQSVDIWASYLRHLAESALAREDSVAAWEEVEEQCTRAVQKVGHQQNSASLWEAVSSISKRAENTRGAVEPEDLEPFTLESGRILWSAVIAHLRRQDAPAAKLEEIFQRWRLEEWRLPEFWQHYLPWVKSGGCIEKVCHSGLISLSVYHQVNSLLPLGSLLGRPGSLKRPKPL